ncbi:hypothetical protein KUTeg_012195 [Tegillarca granosa]|uniref:Gamma tubulin complex component protein N-terminal domain-containing protein n=1 Tax=Tegillarca granosa TaxID=220873 RepID=A0ABQ9F2D0_TEGGR|nr:hypothetical protein KUTeg_012195 [Tegillarca granosa]
MTSRVSNDAGASTALLKKLCCKVTGIPDVVRKGKEKDAAIFSELHRKLQAQGVLKNRWAVLYLLMSLSDSTGRSRSGLSSSIFGRGLPSTAMSTPFNPALQRVGQVPGSNNTPFSNTTLQSVNNSSGSSGISSIRSDNTSNEPTPVPQSFMPSTTFSSVDLDRKAASGPVRSTKPDSNIVLNRGDKTSFELPEAELIKDLVYSFQGIEGKWIKFDPTKEGYRIDSQVGIPKAIRQLASKLAECGWLYTKVKNYVETKSADRTFGLIGQINWTEFLCSITPRVDRILQTGGCFGRTVCKSITNVFL